MRAGLVAAATLLIATSASAQRVDRGLSPATGIVPNGSAFTQTGNIKFNDDVAAAFGSSSDTVCEWDTQQTPDAMVCDPGNDSRVWIFGTLGADYAKAQQTNTTVCVHSEDTATAADLLCFAHDQTDGVISTDAGDIQLNPAGAGNVYLTHANGPKLVDVASSNTVGTIFPDRAGTGFIGGTSSGLSFGSAATSWATMSTAGVWAFRPTSPPATHFQVGSSGTLGFMFDTAITSLVINTGGAQGFNGWLETVVFCGDGPNATTLYYGPNIAHNMFASAGCAALDNATEANVDEVYWPYAVRAMTAHCGINDVANATVTFTLRSATANVDASTTCTTATGDSSGFLDCYFQDLSPSTIAAGATIDFLASSSGNFSTADVWCVLQVSR